jgi:hypothetical protein
VSNRTITGHGSGISFFSFSSRRSHWAKSTLAQSAVGSAHVTVRAKDTGAARTINTNGEGLFYAVDLAPGDYSVEVEASEFTSLTRQITLEVGQNMGLDLALMVGERHEAIAVSATPETLTTQDAAIGEVVDNRGNHPRPRVPIQCAPGGLKQFLIQRLISGAPTGVIFTRLFS